uniref:Uncharacterized protein n=1 Tax=Anguilla anguilla TaxID=7936 RepID=A0A0E9USY9_ANGAN
MGRQGGARNGRWDKPGSHGLSR